MKIGFIGLGNMGGPMAANLAKAGHEVHGFDLTAPMPAGVTAAASAADVAKDAQVVITMLPNGQILRRVADELIGARFTIENPNAASSCGCGTSFSI